MKKLLFIIISFIMTLSLFSCRKGVYLRQDCDYKTSIYSWSSDVMVDNVVIDLGMNSDMYLKISTENEYELFNSKLSYYKNECSFNIESEDEIIDIDFTKKDLIVIYRYNDEYKNFDIEVGKIKYEDHKLEVNGCIDLSKKEGEQKHLGLIYVIIPNKKITSVESSFIEYRSVEPIYTVYKPVIYLYNDKRIDLSIKFKDESRLKTTYPKYNNGWNVSVEKDVISDGYNNYYALFYDEERRYEVDFSEGYYVTKDNAISFLEEKLDYLGFNYKERNEFIMYWLPILEDNGESLVYFEQTDERNKECPMDLSINPDTMLRVIIHIKKANGNERIKEELLHKTERNGFEFIEWGGTVY